MNLGELMKIILGLLFIFYLPGLVLTFSFWRKQEIDFIERNALAFVFSLVTVPLVIFYFHLLTGIKITSLISTLLIITLTFLLGLIGFFRNRE